MMRELSHFAKAMQEMVPWLNASGRVTGGLGFGALLGWFLTGKVGVGAWGWGLGLGLGAVFGLTGFLLAAAKLSKRKDKKEAT